MLDLDREKGPVEILCKEIGFRFDITMERRDIFIAFVRQLVDQVSEMRGWRKAIAGATGNGPSEDSARVLELAEAMFQAKSPTDMIEAAARVHTLGRELNPEDAYPTDHYIDMLESCASAIRFGLALGPCQSRHAAAAASHVWKQKYGIHLFDKFTGAWEHDWTRAQLQDAILSLAIERQCAIAPVNS